jgi:hypothetical protein
MVREIVCVWSERESVCVWSESERERKKIKKKKGEVRGRR